MGAERGEVVPPRNQWTQIIVERPVRFGPPEEIPMVVPFTASEVDQIIAARNAEKGLVSDAMRGSGPIRELYATYTIPWGGSLRDRSDAWNKLTQTRNYAAKILDHPPQYVTSENLQTVQDMKSHLDSLLGAEQQK